MRIRIKLAAFFLIIAGGFLLVGSAYAHAAYQRSEPGSGALVSSPPARVDIWFAQELFRRQGDNWIKVFDANDQPVQVGDVQIDNDDRSHMWVELPSDLKPGTYRVEWKNVSSEDGDPDQGSFSFTYDPQAVITSTPMTAAAAPTEIPPTEPTVLPTSAELPVPTEPSVVPSPTAPESGPATGGKSCVPGMLPIFGSVGLVLIRRLRHPASS
jgi:methionine-rich copper-binding protein CopC